MILNVFAVKDLKAKAFLQPFFSNSRGSAMRAFGDAVQDKNCPFNKHPEDYILYEIGTYDDSSAYLTMVPLDLVVQASDFVVDMPKTGQQKTQQEFEDLLKHPEKMLTVEELSGKKSS